MRISPLLAIVLVTGCAFGRTETVQVDTPYGQHVVLVVDEVPSGFPYPSIIGEALYREPDAVVVLTDRAVVRVHMSRIRQYSIYPMDAGEDPVTAVPATSDPFRGITRYPDPLTSAQLEAILEASDLPFVELAADDAALRTFLAEARAATARFADLETAIAEGYRRLGPSFPGMGEHWIHPSRIVSGRIEAARPQVLCYVRIEAEPRLVSLAYAVPLGPDELPPEEPFGRDAWHDHDDTVDEESLLLAHPASHHGGDGPRLAMVHVWLWPSNPDGPIAQNNWRLPFAEAGLPLDGLDPTPDAARGLSLHTAEPGYYDRLLDAAARLSDSERSGLDATVRRHRALATSWLETRDPADRVGPADLDTLSGIWSSLWRSIRSEVSDSTWTRLAVLR